MAGSVVHAIALVMATAVGGGVVEELWRRKKFEHNASGQQDVALAKGLGRFEAGSGGRLCIL